MSLKSQRIFKGKTCEIPRRHEAIEALLMLAWKKSKQERPKWLIQEINSYS